MIKILHTADWHLGKKLLTADRIPEQTQILDDIITKTNTINPDIILIAGDIFDTPNPGASAETLFYKTLKRLAKPGRLIIIIAGNHDNAIRLSASQPLCTQLGIIIINDPYQEIICTDYNNISITSNHPGTFEFTLNDEKIFINTLVYPTEKNLKINLENYDNGAFSKATCEILAKRHNTTSDTISIIIGHLFLQSSTKTSDQNVEMLGGALAIDIKDLPKSNYIALGHIHKPIVYKNYNAAYSGSILEYRDTEAKFDKCILEVTIQKDETTITKVPLINPRPIKILNFTDIDTAISTCTSLIGESQWLYINLDLKTSISGQELKLLKQNTNILNINIQIDQEQQVKTDVKDLTISEQFIQQFIQIHGQEPDIEQLKILQKSLEQLT